VGPGIQKGVNYGAKKRIFFFGYMVNDELQSWYDFLLFANDLGFWQHLVPIIGLVGGLAAASEFSPELITALNPLGGDICEGIVIQPYKKTYINRGGKRFLLKKKNEKFIEKAKARKPPSPGDPEIERLNAEFKLYITDNRLQGIFSKHGEIEEPSQIGDYIRLMLNDAKEDFLADHAEALGRLEKGEQRKVFNVGGMIANMLK